MMLWLITYAVRFTDVSTDPPPTDIWAWFLANVTVQGTFNIAGLTLLVVLFSRDLILTKGQHLRRVEDIVASHKTLIAEIERAHAAEIAGWQARYDDLVRATSERYSEMKESRDYYRAARIDAAAKIEELTDHLIDSNKALGVAARALGAFETASQQAGSGP